MLPCADFCCGLDSGVKGLPGGQPSAFSRIRAMMWALEAGITGLELSSISVNLSILFLVCVEREGLRGGFQELADNGHTENRFLGLLCSTLWAFQIGVSQRQCEEESSKELAKMQFPGPNLPAFLIQCIPRIWIFKISFLVAFALCTCSISFTSWNYC